MPPRSWRNLRSERPARLSHGRLPQLRKAEVSAIIFDGVPRGIALGGVLNEARDYYRGNHVISDAEWSEYMKELESAD